MKLGIINGWEEKCIKYVKDKGLDAVEFCVNHNYDADEFLSRANEIKGYSEKYGIPVGSMGRWGMKRIDENGKVIPEALHADKALIDAAEIIGCPVYNVGVNEVESLGYYDNCRIAIDYLSQLLDYARGRGVKIATYNCDWENFVFDDRAWSVIHTALPELGIKYDASHCLSRRGDYLKELRDWGDRVYHFHIKGVLYIDGEGYDDAPAGLDEINWGGVMDILYTKDYDGMLSIEPHSNYWKGRKGQWGVDFTIKYFRPFIMPEDYDYDESPYMP
ncbi:MAG: sugar phosphate isomerase/epimerase [Clostridia bacterium]|nr:sugar phosphate isomerase/epimerase [Clostridia bacterium]